MSGEAARDLAGADQSAWNGNVTATTGGLLGLANWDGTLYLDHETILGPLEQMYEHAGEDQPTPTLVSYREALATLLHEHAHFLGPANASQEEARLAFTQPGGRQLEEGVAEAWAQDNLTEYLTCLGIDKVAPGIENVQSDGYYAAFVPAIRKLTSDLETRNDLRPGRVLELLNRQTSAGQFPVLASLIYNSTRLPELEPAGTDTRARLEALLRYGLSQLDNYQLAPNGFAAAKSDSTARKLLDHLHQEVQRAESACTPHPPACALPPPAQTALSGIAPPTPNRPTTPSSPIGAPTSAQRLSPRGRPTPATARACG